MSRSPIGDLVAEHLRRVRMLRAEFEDERARLEAKGAELLAEARAAEERVAEQQAAAQQEPVTEPQPVVDIDAIRREEQLRDATARAAAEQARAAAALEVRAAEQQAPAAVQHTPTNWSPPSGASSLEDDALREAREAIARSAAARRAAERVEPVDYDGYDQESEYFRGKNWFG